ncbi:MAG: hypothetical protein ACKO7W_02245 [Elainella sp.]
MRQQIASILLILLLLIGLVAPFSTLAGLMLLAVISLGLNLVAAVAKALVTPSTPTQSEERG